MCLGSGKTCIKIASFLFLKLNWWQCVLLRETVMTQSLPAANGAMDGPLGDSLFLKVSKHWQRW